MGIGFWGGPDLSSSPRSRVNSPDGEDGCTPLQLACRKGDVGCLLELLECRARVDGADRRGETAFHYAVRGHNPQVVEVGAGLGRERCSCFRAALTSPLGARRAHPPRVCSPRLVTALPLPAGFLGFPNV